MLILGKDNPPSDVTSTSILTPSIDGFIRTGELESINVNPFSSSLPSETPIEGGTLLGVPGITNSVNNYHIIEPTRPTCLVDYEQQFIQSAIEQFALLFEDRPVSRKNPIKEREMGTNYLEKHIQLCDRYRDES